MNAVFLLAEISHVQFEDVAHDVVEHEEAGGFLDGWFAGVRKVDQIEDGGQYFVHALHVLDFGVEFREYKQNACHVVVAIGCSLLFPTEHAVFLFASSDEFEFLPAGVGVKGDEYGLDDGWEKRKFGLGSTGVLLDLLPHVEVFLVGGPEFVLFGEVERIVGVLLGIDKLLNELIVGVLLLLDLRFPAVAFLRQVAKD